MTNEEKARDIALENVVEYHTIDDNGTEHLTHCYNECKKSALEMAAWKDEELKKRIGATQKVVYQHGLDDMKKEMIDETCEWLLDHAYEYLKDVSHFNGTWSIDTQKLTEDYRKAMEW